MRGAAVAVLLCAALAQANPNPSSSPYARLHLSATGFGDAMSHNVGAEVGASFAPGSSADIGAAANLGRFIGARLTVGFHTSRPLGAGFRPLLQLRGIVHPVGTGIGVGAGALLGGSIEAGPGRFTAGVQGEVISGPQRYLPLAVQGVAGYELDLFKSRPVVASVQVVDSDGDGIPDPEDACPNEPGLAALQGCPSRDSDRDGVADEADKCPSVPGPARNAGCPVSDRDGDGIADDVDKCPDEAETFNGIDDEDGCPEKEAAAYVVKKKIVITQRVYFESNKDRILSKSYSILTSVANVLKKFPEIKKVRVEGHTDDVGSDETNKDLSERRAANVLSYLTRGGVDASRLESVGYGKTRPLVTGDTEEARGTNRRVEFLIVDPAEYSTEPGPARPR